jgi:hypothetical protein
MGKEAKEVVKRQVEVRTVSLYPNDVFIIQALARRNGWSDSQAIRWIVRDWAQRMLGDDPTEDMRQDIRQLLEKA